MFRFKQTFKLMSVLSLCVASSFVQARNLDAIVAEVNGTVITQGQLDNETQQLRADLQRNQQPVPDAHTLEKKVLNQLIDRQMQVQLAKENNVKVDDVALEQQLTRIAEEHHISREQLPEALKKQGIQFNQFKEEVRRQAIVAQLQQSELGPKIKITDQEVNREIALLKVQAHQNSGAQYHVQDIAFVNPAKGAQQAAQLSERLKKQEKLEAALAALKVLPQEVKLNDLEWRTLEQMPDIFTKVVPTLAPGEISAPIQAPNGWHVLRLVDKKVAASAVPTTLTLTHVRHILIKTNPLNTAAAVKVRLADIRNRIVHGEDFANMAGALSQDPGSASAGGGLGWVKPGQLDPTFEQKMDHLAINEISEPFATSFGWHLVQVLGRRTETDVNEVLRDQARRQIFQKRFEQLAQNWVKQLRTQAYVKIAPEYQ